MVVQIPPRFYSIEEYFGYGNWLFSESDVKDGVLTLVSANCQIPHRQIYERVKFDINEQSIS